MFQDHPETRDYFPKFQDLDSSDKQRNSEEFKDHAEKVKCNVCIMYDCQNPHHTVLCPITHHSDAYSSSLGHINQSNGWDGPELIGDAWTPEGGQLVVTNTGACQGKLGWDGMGMAYDNGAYPETARPGEKYKHATTTSKIIIMFCTRYLNCRYL